MARETNLEARSQAAGGTRIVQTACPMIGACLGGSCPVYAHVKDGQVIKFEPVIDDTRVQDKSAVKRVVLTSGKLYWDLNAEAVKREASNVSLVRLEQYYPLPIDEILAVLAQYPSAEIVWAQEEPNNMGAWPFLLQELNPLLQGRTITGVTRPASASPATGSTKRSAQEQADVISRALTV